MAVVELIDEVEDYQRETAVQGREREWRVRDPEMLFTWQVGAAVSKFTLQGDPHGTLVLNGT